MSAHDWHAVISYKISEDVVRSLTDPEGEQVFLDEENREGLTVGCYSCGKQFPEIQAGTECPGPPRVKWQKLELGDRVRAFDRAGEEIVEGVVSNTWASVGEHSASPGIRLALDPEEFGDDFAEWTGTVIEARAITFSRVLP